MQRQDAWHPEEVSDHLDDHQYEQDHAQRACKPRVGLNATDTGRGSSSLRRGATLVRNPFYAADIMLSSNDPNSGSALFEPCGPAKAAGLAKADDLSQLGVRPALTKRMTIPGP